jgi:hypothetical protein
LRFGKGAGARVLRSWRERGCAREERRLAALPASGQAGVTVLRKRPALAGRFILGRDAEPELHGELGGCAIKVAIFCYNARQHGGTTKHA